MLSLTLLLVLMFFPDLFSIVINRLWEERAGLYVDRAFICFSCIPDRDFCEPDRG